jgi:hypothetical protein
VFGCGRMEGSRCILTRTGTSYVYAAKRGRDANGDDHSSHESRLDSECRIAACLSTTALQNHVRHTLRSRPALPFTRIPTQLNKTAGGVSATRLVGVVGRQGLHARARVQVPQLHLRHTRTRAPTRANTDDHEPWLGRAGSHAGALVTGSHCPLAQQLPSLAGCLQP